MHHLNDAYKMNKVLRSQLVHQPIEELLNCWIEGRRLLGNNNVRQLFHMGIMHASEQKVKTQTASRVYMRALDACGLEFRSDKLWE
uniref:Uncharacterized protein n=1 Tax=Ditylenchus dipsaci TaxID=166011 RepID=A0A915D5R1_9BILA